MAYTEREQVVEVLNRLFYYTDYQRWDQLQDEVFAEEVHLDMTSMGAPQAEMMLAREICEAWSNGFAGLDAVHHQAGNYIIDITGTTAEAKAYAVASHFKADATEGNTRAFTGSYDFTLQKTEKGWRLTRFKFNLKYTSGNLDLK